MEKETSSAYSKKNVLNRKFIPSQRIIGSNKELFIIKYEVSVIETHHLTIFIYKQMDLNGLFQKDLSQQALLHPSRLN